MADTSILGDDVVLTLNLQDDGTIQIKQSDLAKLLPTVDASTGDWLVSGVDSGVRARADTVAISSSTFNWVINGSDTGVTALGAQGTKGNNGDAGVSFAINSVTIGDSASVTNSGTTSDVKLDIVLPKATDGKNGITPSFKIGTVTTGDSASVTDSVDGTTHTLSFVIPRQDLSAYTATDALTKLLTDKVDKSTLTSYYTASQMDTKLSNKADLSMVANIVDKDTVATLSDKVSKLQDQVNSQAQTIVKLQDQANTLSAKLATPTTQESR
ncbi:hypothetical protein [Limosilactobacillus gastricus]|uniref:hypothetical protein n=1 Tax=Limosilactobacillus gastricus TaxID=227942 RepID=UPI0002F08C13|nr:hypothetical protein [Limosilactobacillus gastricus]